MKIFYFVIILCVPLGFFYCSANEGKKKELSVLVLGNSITYHAPSEPLGWQGDWGMAASSADKDFESRLLQKLSDAGKYGKVTLTPQNIAYWENNFDYDLNQFTKASGKKYDVIVVRLGENVNQSAESFMRYKDELNKMINHFKSPASKIVITGTVWFSNEKDQIQQKVADENGYSYISLMEFQANPKNYAYGQFTNEQVAAHPSDTGMEYIAEALYKKILQVY